MTHYATSQPDNPNLPKWEQDLLTTLPPRTALAGDLDTCAVETQSADGLDRPRGAHAKPVWPVDKVDYPRLAGKAIGTIGVLSGRLATIGRWLDTLEDGSVSLEYAMAHLRKAQSEALAYANGVYEELSAS